MASSGWGIRFCGGSFVSLVLDHLAGLVAASKWRDFLGVGVALYISNS